jgi:hypothetical protein
MERLRDRTKQRDACLEMRAWKRGIGSMPQEMEWTEGPKQPGPPHDPQVAPLKDPPDEPMHDPAGDLTYEPEQPFGDPTPTPGRDPRPENPEVNATAWT